MPCEFTFSRADGNTVPYPPLQDAIRNNRGFEDLRGKPARAAMVAEGGKSVELRRWLIELAEPMSRLFSLGCDIGTFKRKEPVPCSRATGGYIQLIAAGYQGREIRDYTDLAERLSIPVREGADEEHWEVSFLIQTVAFKLDGQDDYVQSLCIEFNAWARNAAEAAASRERLVGLLRAACAADPVFGRTQE